jgi:aspartate 1-decarboxylase
MLREVLYCKIHMARVTAAKSDYIGSITIDADLLDAVGLRVNDKVLVGNSRNGARFETYVFRGEPGSGVIELNGNTVAQLVEIGDPLIIMAFAMMDEKEYAKHKPKVALVHADNSLAEVIRYEPHPVGHAQGKIVQSASGKTTLITALKKHANKNGKAGPSKSTKKK